MNPLATRHLLLRDRADWFGTASGLAFDADGVASLMPVPEPPASVALAAPFVALPSGVACLACGGDAASDAARHALVVADGACGTRAQVRASLDTPMGIAFAPGRGLYVADGGHARVVLLRDPTLEVVAAWSTGFADPGALAVDSLGRVVVADVATGRMRRFGTDGTPDAAFAAATAAVAARFLAFAGADVLHVAAPDGRLLRFAPDGSPLPALAALDPALAAGALAACGDRLHVADTATGVIAVLDLASGARVATVPRFVGPVTALACCETGTLLVKTDDGEAVLRCPPTAVAAAGTITAGPFDAGERDTWFVALVEAGVPAGSSVALEVFASEAPAPGPGPADWVTALAGSTLVAPLFPALAPRHAWMRVTLRSDDARTTPRLAQVRLETPGEDYLDQLPAIYRNADVASGFLARLVAALRVQFDASERRVDGLAQRLSSGFAPKGELAWLASWLGFDLPAGLDAKAQRALVARLPALLASRGTAAGIAELVHVCTGVRPRIMESWRERRLWQLGTDSVLGFDTGLAPATPAGMVVPDSPGRGCAPPAIGSAVVGEAGPLAADDFGATLFAGSAHRFIVSVPAFQAPDGASRDAIRRVLEREKPAHTDYALCFVEAEMRVGLQAQLGIDTYVACAPVGASLEGMTLDLDARLAGSGGVGRVSSNGRLGVDTRLA